MIDYSLRTCVERDITVRRCKNCGRWFPQMVRVSAEYCERPVPKDEQVCREIGAFKQWTKRQSDDPVFKLYRREYKKRFAWIKAGNIAEEDSKSGAKKPEGKRRNATVATSRWKNSSSGWRSHKRLKTTELTVCDGQLRCLSFDYSGVNTESRNSRLMQVAASKGKGTEVQFMLSTNPEVRLILSRCHQSACNRKHRK